MIYLFLYALLLLVGFVSFKTPAARRLFFAIFVFVLFIFVAFRYKVGCDWSGYYNNFEAARYLEVEDVLTLREPGFWLLLIQLHAWKLEYPYLNVVMAVPFFWGMTAMARRQPDPLAFLILSFPVLIINLPMSGIRQGAAVGFICLAFLAFQDRKLARYILFVILGALVHTSAIIFFALAPFIKFGFTRSTLLAAVVLAVPGAYFDLTDSLNLYVDRYVSTGVDARGALFRSGMLALVGLTFLLSWSSKFKKLFARENSLVSIGSWIMLATLAILPISTVISDRFGYYVTPIQLIILSRMPLLAIGRYRLLMVVAPYLALGLVLLVWTSLSVHFNKCYLPYQTWLDWQY